MPIIKVLKLIASNFYFIYKILLYYLICIVLLVVAYQFIISPAIVPIIAKLNEFNVIESFKNIIDNFIKLNQGDLETSIEAFKIGFEQFLNYVQQGGLTGLIFAVLGFYMLSVYLLAFKDIAACIYLENQVSSKLKVSFIGLLIKNAKKSLLYTLMVVIISTIFMLLFIPLLYLISVVLFSYMGVFSLFFIILIGAAFYSFYFSMFAFCLPQVAEGKNIFKSYFKGIKLSAKHFAKVFPMTIVLVIFIFFINVIVIFFTFGAGAIFTFPLVFLSIVSFKVVLQYGAYNKPFYVGLKEVAQINLQEDPMDVKLDNEEEITDEIADEDEDENDKQE